MSDPIITELWKIKDGLAKECGYDLAKLFARLKAAQASEKSPLIDRTKQREAAAAQVAESPVAYLAQRAGFRFTRSQGEAALEARQAGVSVSANARPRARCGRALVRGEKAALGTRAEAQEPGLLVGTNRFESVWRRPDGIALTVVTNRLGVMTGLSAPRAGDAGENRKCCRTTCCWLYDLILGKGCVFGAIWLKYKSVLGILAPIAHFQKCAIGGAAHRSGPKPLTPIFRARNARIRSVPRLSHPVPAQRL